MFRLLTGGGPRVPGLPADELDYPCRVTEQRQEVSQREDGMSYSHVAALGRSIARPCDLQHLRSYPLGQLRFGPRNSGSLPPRLRRPEIVPAANAG